MHLKIIIYKIFSKQNPILYHPEIGILNNLDLEGMDKCSKNNFFKREQSELSKLINDRTIIITPADRGEGAVVVLSTKHYKTMIMQHLNGASTYNKFNLNIYTKI